VRSQESGRPILFFLSHSCSQDIHIFHRARSVVAAAVVSTAMMNETSSGQPPSSSEPPSRKRYYPSHFKTNQDQELIRLALHKSPFFTCLDEEQIDRFVAVAERKEFSPGAIVILEGCVDDNDDEEETKTLGKLDAATTSTTTTTTVPEIDEAAPADPDEDILAEEEEVEEGGEGPKKGLREEVKEEIEGNENRASGVEAEEASSAVVSAEEEQATTASEPLHNSWELPSPSSDPPPPSSGVKRSIYIVRNGTADVWYQPQNFRRASLGPGTLFGEGGFLFGRQHSASVVAARQRDSNGQESQQQGLDCFVVDFNTFREYVLPSDNMSHLFIESATMKDQNGEPYMTMEEFVEARSRLQNTINAASRRLTTLEDPMASLRIVSSIHKSTRRRGSELHKGTDDERVYLEDFCFFQLLMDRPDPEVDIAFLLMDQRQTGQICLDDLAKFVEPLFPDLDIHSQFFQRYFGKKGNQSIRQLNFSQFLVDLQREIGKQAFLRGIAKKGEAHTEGYLDPDEFINVLTTACGSRLPQGVADRLRDIYGSSSSGVDDATNINHIEVSRDREDSVDGSATGVSADMGSQYFAYGDFLAFQEVLGNLPGICNLIDRAEELKKGPISADDFKVANRVMGLGGRLSRGQVEIVFALFDRDRDGYISHDDTVNVCGMDFVRSLVAVPGRGGVLTFAPATSDYLQLLEHEAKRREQNRGPLLHKISVFAQHFLLTAVASSLGVMLLYPVDLAKTRLMNEQIGLGKSGMYKGWIDCLQQVLRFEGARGLYRGVTPQLLGAAPEKIIKLQVNDLVRQVIGLGDDGSGSGNSWSTTTKKINLPVEVLSGACAGACQLLITNPMEIAKIRMQLHGETARILESRGVMPLKPRSFGAVVRDLGFPGVYRGASACLLRDVPFSAIYFPAYAVLKEFLIDQQQDGRERKATPTNLLLAGTLAGIPAAFLTTPMDVIKTRLQAAPRAGERQYTGIRDCATNIYRNEGWQTLFRGSVARVLRIAPQFGVSLLAYEQLSQWREGESGQDRRPPTNAPIHPQDYRNAFLSPSADRAQP
jgi:solute carrier family 25 aspartate/glutamate transporter 12/13